MIESLRRSQLEVVVVTDDLGINGTLSFSRDISFLDFPGRGLLVGIGIFGRPTKLRNGIRRTKRITCRKVVHGLYVTIPQEFQLLRIKFLGTDRESRNRSKNPLTLSPRRRESLMHYKKIIPSRRASPSMISNCHA